MEPEQRQGQVHPLGTARYDLIVAGGGLGGLVAARSAAKRGKRVLVIERENDVGGNIARHTVAGLQLDAGAESFAHRGGQVMRYIRQLGIENLVVSPRSGGAWLYTATPSGTAAVPLPATGLLGIPGRPLRADVRAVVGFAGALRAALDLVLPAGRFTESTTLGQVVRARMGTQVLQRLVSPVITGVYSAEPDQLVVSVVHPQLYAALRRHRSLSRAVREISAQGKAGSAASGLRGGLFEIIVALKRSLAELGVTTVTNTSVDSLAKDDAGWRVNTGIGEVAADSLIIAVDYERAVHLINPFMTATGQALDGVSSADPIELVSLVVDSHQLDSAPRGTGLLVNRVGTGMLAKALTHASCKWEWIAEVAGAGRHIVRLSYDGVTVGDWTDEQLFARATSDAETLLGVSDMTVVATNRVCWRASQPAASVSARGGVQSVIDRIEALGDCTVVGAWVAGTGLASVIPQALASVDRLYGEACPESSEQSPNLQNEAELPERSEE